MLVGYRLTPHVCDLIARRANGVRARAVSATHQQSRRETGNNDPSLI